MKGVYKRNISMDSESESSGDECISTFEDMVYHAGKEDRLTTGVFECANVLETDPDIVMLCILPCTKSGDISIHIQHKLIEAYCWENSIELVKIDSVQLNSTVKLPRSKTTAMDDIGCVLVTSEIFKDVLEDDMTLSGIETFG